MYRKFFIFLFFCFSLLVSHTVYAENIDPDNTGNDFAVLEFDDSQISFDCTNCNVEVTSTEITGYAWSETAGWINLQPGSSGVVNDGDGNLSGYAWGENIGWINFDPTFGGVSISSGQFDGYAWSENYGWIQFDCGVTGACVETSWVPTTGSGGGGGGASEGCTDPLAINYDEDAEVNDGSCMFEGIELGCTNPEAVNYSPSADVDNNTCQFGDVETPDNPNEDSGGDTSGPGDPTPGDGELGGGGFGEGGSGLPVGGDSSSDSDSSSSGDGSSNLNPSFLDVLPILGSSDVALSLGAFLALLGSILLLPFQQLLQLPLRISQLLFSWFQVTKKPSWGIVFDAVTKQPLDPVVVSLKDVSGAVIQTSITDMEGRYGFLAPPGMYSIEAHKADYVFPSKILLNEQRDTVYSHLYFGGTFEVRDGGEIITRNIPLDPVGFNWNEFEKRKLGLLVQVKKDRRVRALSLGLFSIGFSSSIVAIFVSPSIWNYIILSLYVVAGILQVSILPKKAGRVVSRDGMPLSFGVLRVYSQTLNKEMKKVVLDASGRYYCLIRNGEYYVTLEARNQDGTYSLVHTSRPFSVRGGVIRKKIII